MFKNKTRDKRINPLNTIVVVLLLAFPTRIPAQSPYIDSLKKELKKYPENLVLGLKLASAHLKSGNIDTAQLLYTEIAKQCQPPAISAKCKIRDGAQTKADTTATV
jgi:hypothetical protein